VSERRVQYYAYGVELHDPTVARPYYRIIYRTPEGVRKVPSAGKDLEQAKAKASSIVDELAAAVADPTGRSVNDLLNAWLPQAEKEYAENHWDKYLSMSRRFISPLLGQHSAWTLSKDDVKTVLDAPVATSAKRHTRNALGAMLVWAHEHDWVEQPYGHFFPKRSRTAKRDEGRKHGETIQFIPENLRPSPEACLALAEAMREQGGEKHGEQLWLMVTAAATCGMRQGELFAATPSRLRPATGEWLIDRQVIRVKSKAAIAKAPQDAEDVDEEGDLVVAADDEKAGTVRITAPKWGRTRSTILPELTIWGEPFREPLLAYAATRLADDVLFPAARGGFMHPSNMSRAWLKAARAAAAPA
jgi:hypothetical protein